MHFIFISIVIDKKVINISRELIIFFNQMKSICNIFKITTSSQLEASP